MRRWISKLFANLMGNDPHTLEGNVDKSKGSTIYPPPPIPAPFHPSFHPTTIKYPQFNHAQLTQESNMQIQQNLLPNQFYQNYYQYPNFHYPSSGYPIKQEPGVQINQQNPLANQLNPFYQNYQEPGSQINQQLNQLPLPNQLNQFNPASYQNYYTASGYPYASPTYPVNPLLIPPSIPQSNPKIEVHPASVPKLKDKLHENLAINNDIFDDYPDGYLKRECIAGSPEDVNGSWKYSKWAWRSFGNQCREDGRFVEVRRCLGVLQCPGKCGRVSRPMTDVNARKRQQDRNCPKCLAFPVHRECFAQTHHYSIIRDDDHVMVWEHFGDHLHPRPPGGRLTKAEKAVLDTQVKRRHDATAHQLRTGDNAPGSVPLHQISPALTNPRKARYQVNKSRERLGINLSANKGALNTLHTLGQLNDEFDVPFIVGSQFHGPTFICLQTPFMEELVKVAVNNWILDEDEGLIASRHGFVVDGDNSYFHHGVLLVSCCFDTTLQTWAPVLYTWIDRQDIGHHRPHFQRLFQTVMKFAGDKFVSRLLLHIMDFSGSQIGAHAEEYADAMISRIAGFDDLSSGAKKEQRKHLVEEAQKYTVGCDIHFTRSLSRVKKLIASDKIPLLEENVDILRGRFTTPDEFDSAVATIRKNFTRLHGWLQWWLRPTIASMIFPVCSQVNPELSKRVPSTSNAAENAHSILHHSSKKDQELVPGIKAIYLHMREIEARFRAIESGESESAAINEKPNIPHPKKYIENDGRAPDTIEALTKTLPASVSKKKKSSAREKKSKTSKQSTVSKPDTLPTQTTNPNALQSYKWEKPNSCFFDHGLELFYRAFTLWDSNTIDSVKKSLPSASYLSSAIHHFERRLRKLDSTDLSYARELGMAQKVLSHCIFEKWKVCEPGEYGNADYWVHHAIMDCNPPSSIQSHFRIQHLLNFHCKAEHTYIEPLPFRPVITSYHLREVEMVKQIHGENCTVTDYFAHYIPREMAGKMGNSPIHERPGVACLSKGCNAIASIVSITTCWPLVLHIKPSAMSLQFKNALAFEVKSELGLVKYQLVGRVLWHGPHNLHYTAEILIEDQCYAYDDMTSGGRLKEIDSDFIASNRETVYYVYHRESENAQSNRLTSDIMVDYSTKPQDEVIVIKDDTPTPSTQSTDWHRTIDTKKIASPDHPTIDKKTTTNDFPQLLPLTREKSSSPFPTPTLRAQSVKPNLKGPGVRILDCKGCSNQHSDKLVMCELCKKWSHIECMLIIDAIPENFDVFMDEYWACPICLTDSGNSQWDQTFIRQFLLFQPNAHGKFYPAQIQSRKEKEVQLSWYTGNIYDQNDNPVSLQFTRTVQQCIDAYKRDRFNTSKAKVGAIRWPLSLVEEAVEYGYRHELVETSLAESYNAILSIITGRRWHPIMDLFSNWTPKTGNKRKRVEPPLDFLRLFNLNILPGDLSILENFLGELRNELKTKFSALDADSLALPADLLFRIVVMRVYLGQNSLSDGEIFYLAYNGSDPITGEDHYHAAVLGSLARHATLAEQARRAGHGADFDTRSSALTLSSVTPFTIVDAVTDPQATVEFPLASAYDSAKKPYKWQNLDAEHSLSGGPAVFPNLLRQTFEELNPDPVTRPKPRPKIKKQKVVHSPENVKKLDVDVICRPMGRTRSGRQPKQHFWGPKLVANGKRSPKDKKKPGWEYEP